MGMGLGRESWDLYSGDRFVRGYGVDMGVLYWVEGDKVGGS